MSEVPKKVPKTVQVAAVREVRLRLKPRELRLHSTVGVPQLKQIYHTFTVRLPNMVTASAVAPGLLAVGRFSEAELIRLPVWQPGLFSVDTPKISYAHSRRSL